MQFSCMRSMTHRKRILVPVKPALNHNKAVETAISFAKELCADMHFISILPKNAVQLTKEEVIANLSLKIKLCSEQKIRATYELMNTDTREKIGEELARVAEKFDLVVIGHTQYDQMYRFLHKSPAVDIINQISVPVIVVPDEKPKIKKA